MNEPYIRKFKSEVTLSYQDKEYTFIYDFQYEEKGAANVYINWTEGNFSCDCNRADFIAQYCDEDFPELECGTAIKLVSLKAIEIGVVDGGTTTKELQA